MFNIRCAQKPSRAVLHKHLTGSDGKANLNNFIVGTFKANAVDLKKCEHNYTWMPLIPGAFYAFVTITYIMNAQIGFNMSWTAAYIVGTVCAVVYLVGIIMYGKKRAAKIKLA